MPAASRIGFSATTVCIVVQLGLATIPRWPSSASGFTSATTSGTSSCMRQKDELSTTTAPASAKRRRPLLADRASRRRRARGRSPVSTRRTAPRPRGGGPRSRCAGRPSARTRTARSRSAGKPRSRMTPSMVEPTAPVAPTTATLTAGPPHDLRPVHPGHVLGLHRVPAELEGRVQPAHRGLHVLLAHDAGDLDRRGGDHLDVHARVSQDRRALAATPGWLFIPAPTRETLPM